MSAMGPPLIVSRYLMVLVASMLLIVGQFAFNGEEICVSYELRRIVVASLPQSWRNGVSTKYWWCYSRKLL